VRLVDFGLARFEGEAAAGGRGAPGYAAPELVRGGEATVASDLYALGATLFALASGRRAFEATSVPAILRLQPAGPPPSPRRPAAVRPARRSRPAGAVRPARAAAAVARPRSARRGRTRGAARAGAAVPGGAPPARRAIALRPHGRARAGACADRELARRIAAA